MKRLVIISLISILGLCMMGAAPSPKASGEYVTICDQWRLMDTECSDGNYAIDWNQRTCTLYWYSNGTYSYVSSWTEDDYIPTEVPCDCEDEYDCKPIIGAGTCEEVLKRTCCGTESMGRINWDCTGWETYAIDCDGFSLCN